MSHTLNSIIHSILATFIWVFIALDTLIVFLTLAILKPFDRKERLSYRIANFWGQSIMRLNPFWRLTISGGEHIEKDKAYVLVANHQSLGDIVCLYCLGRHFKWLAKASLFKIPFFGWSMSLLNYIPLRRGEHGSIRDSFQEAQACLENGISVLIFPEGTRSRTGALGEFKNGAFKLATRTKKPIVPIVIRGTGEAMSKGRAAMAATVRGSLKVLPEIKTDNYPEGQYGELKTKVWNLMRKELEHAPADSMNG